MLHEARERPGKPPVELLGVDLAGDGFDDFGAAAGPITRDAVGVVGSEPAQDPGPVQEIVHQGIDRDHGAADFAPPGPRTGRAEKQLRQRHHQDLVGNAVDFSQRIDQGRSHSGQPVWLVLVGDGLQAPVNPADEVPVGDVANEQVQRVGGLVEPAVAQPKVRQRALGQVIGLGTGVPALIVPAVVTASSF
jgi:hypothetical protein